MVSSIRTTPGTSDRISFRVRPEPVTRVQYDYQLWMLRPSPNKKQRSLTEKQTLATRIVFTRVAVDTNGFTGLRSHPPSWTILEAVSIHRDMGWGMLRPREERVLPSNLADSLACLRRRFFSSQAANTCSAASDWSTKGRISEALPVSASLKLLSGCSNEIIFSHRPQVQGKVIAQKST